MCSLAQLLTSSLQVSTNVTQGKVTWQRIVTVHEMQTVAVLRPAGLVVCKHGHEVKVSGPGGHVSLIQDLM